MIPNSTKEPLSEQWFKSLFKKEIQTDLENYGIFIQHGKARHSAINIAENKIRELKRVLQKSQSHRFCLIQKCVQNKGKLKQICVSRPCEYISFVCHGTENNIVFEPQYNLFNFDECLQQPQAAKTIYNLPPAQMQQMQPMQQMQQTMQQPAQKFSKRGRLIKSRKNW